MELFIIYTYVRHIVTFHLFFSSSANNFIGSYLTGSHNVTLASRHLWFSFKYKHRTYKQRQYMLTLWTEIKIKWLMYDKYMCTKVVGNINLGGCNIKAGMFGYSLWIQMAFMHTYQFILWDTHHMLHYLAFHISK